jgi:co-chaperonin GroES (HSP10)
MREDSLPAPTAILDLLEETSMFRLVALFVVAAAVVMIATGAAYAAEKAADKTHDGLVVSVSEGKLVMTDNDGKNEHSHAILATTKITLNGKAAKLADLKAGDKITVSQGEGGKVTAVDAKRAA